MKTYKLKKIVNGYKVNPLFKNSLLMPIPYQANEGIEVIYKNKSYLIKGEPLAKKTFPDKFGREKLYTLYYYELPKEKLFKEPKDTEQEAIIRAHNHRLEEQLNLV